MRREVSSEKLLTVEERGHHYDTDVAAEGHRPLALVTGGTGTVGGVIVRRLLSAGYRVRAFARHAGQSTLPQGATAFSGDVQDMDALRAAMRGVQAVVHAVGVLREGRGQTYEGVHVQGARNAVIAAQGAGVRRFILVGGVRADPASKDPLSRSKGLAEAEVRGSGLDWTVLRSSMVFGVQGGTLDRIRWSLRATPPLVLLPCGGRGLFQPLWVEDLASCVLACLAEGRGVGRVYDLGGPETWSYRDLVLLLKRRMGVRRILAPAPSWLLLAGASLPRLVGKAPLVTATELRQVCMDNRTDLSVLPREFGIAPARLEEKLNALLTNQPYDRAR
jgi:NADH dehydrogenase